MRPAAQATRRGAAALLPLACLLIAGCATGPKIPDDALRLSESTLEVRAIQTRNFEAPSEIIILAASVGVLQDMEFNIDFVEKPLGVLSASKVVDADSEKEQLGLFLLDLLCIASGSSDCGASASASDQQKVSITLIVLPSLARPDEFTARITMQTIVFDKMERVKQRAPIESADVYQQIFDKLSKSIFLEANAS